MNRDAAGIIATIFEAPEPFYEDRNDIATGDCSDNSTHDEASMNLDGKLRMLALTTRNKLSYINIL